MGKANMLFTHRRGFTLIELLLGLSLFSIIALIVYSTFSGGLMLSRRANHQNDIYRQARWSLELIKTFPRCSCVEIVKHF